VKHNHNVIKATPRKTAKVRPGAPTLPQVICNDNASQCYSAGHDIVVNNYNQYNQCATISDSPGSCLAASNQSAAAATSCPGLADTIRMQSNVIAALESVINTQWKLIETLTARIDKLEANAIGRPNTA